MVADVSAVANPSTGVAVYDSYAYQAQSGWLQFGGTSVASPIVAAVYALAGNTASLTYGSYPYSHSTSLYDVTSGNNGSCVLSPAYFCTAGAGYDGPTGLGTPQGTGAF
jgi:subtilase family serine protease